MSLVVDLVGPEKIFVTGEGVAMYELGRESAQLRFEELLHWTATAPEIVVQQFGFTEWARGAAVVAIQQHIRQLTSVYSD